MDTLMIALQDCAQASTHEPDAETINAAIVRIRELEAKLAQWETFYQSEMQRERGNYNVAIQNGNNVARQTWNAAIEAAVQFCNTKATCFDSGKIGLCDAFEFGEGHTHYGQIYAAGLQSLKK